jgi:hypothetical protein
MNDKFQFSDNQTLTNLDSTGVVSTNIWDLEEGAAADQQLVGWLNIVINAVSFTGLTEGLNIEMRSADATNLSTTPTNVVGSGIIPAAEVVAGAVFCLGVNKANLERYAGVWYKAISTAATGTINVEAHFSNQPMSAKRLQKKPV